MATVMAASDSQVGNKDLMLSLEKEAVERNQVCWEEALRRIIDQQVADAVVSEPALDQFWIDQWTVIITWQRGTSGAITAKLARSY